MLVTIDTLRADHVGAYGADPSPTPALDALAAEGTRFDAAFAPTPLTLPSHATLHTGRDPHEHGARHNGSFPLPADVPTLAESLASRGWATAAFVGAYVLDRSFGLGRGFDVYDDQMEIARGGTGASHVAERRGDIVVDAALAWLKEAPEQFFLWVHLYDPHADYRAPEPFRSRFELRYDGEIAFADAQVARLREAVAARWPDERTLWVVTSDHGESLGEHGEATHAYSLYDATQRVPLLLAGPDVPAGSSVESVVALRDVAPTLGAWAAASPLEGVTGRSLAPLLGGEPDPPRTAYLETLAPQLDWRWSPLLGLRTDTHKYIRAPRPELYALREDPGETADLAGSDPALAAELDALLELRLAAARSSEPAALPDAAARARLEALGYVVGDRLPHRGKLGRVGGIDPKDEIELVAALQHANQLLGSYRAEEAFAELDALGPRGLEVAYLRSVAALGAGRMEDARSAARETVELEPASALGWGLLGRIEEAGGSLERAREHYHHAASLGTGAGSAETGLGRVAEARGDREAAEAHYRAAIASRLPDLEAHWRLAALHLERRETAASEAHLARVPLRSLSRPDAAGRLARAEASAGRNKKAIQRLQTALRQHPGSSILLRAQADILDALGKPGAALASREKALEASPESAPVRNELAWTLARLGRDLERAESLARSAVEDTGGDPGTIDTLSAVLLAKGELAAALELAESASEHAAGVNLAFLHYRRAEALHGLGRTDEADAAFAMARAAGPERPDRVLRELDARISALLDEAAG